MVKFQIIIYNLLIKFKNFSLNIKVSEIESKKYINYIKSQISKKRKSYIADGFKVYSQNDEDGIINSIFKDIKYLNKTFIEIGSGSGLENNTHYLLLKGWKGVWIDSNKRYVNNLNKKLGGSKNLAIFCDKVTPSNINEKIEKCLNFLKLNDDEAIDFFSIDIDSIDIYCLKKINKLKPRLICIEYNAKFPPDIEISIENDIKNYWKHDDYMGSSLAFIVHEMQNINYRLVSTNITGINAFFVRDDLYPKCKTVNQTINELYMPINYHLFNYVDGHRPTLKFLINKLKKK